MNLFKDKKKDNTNWGQSVTGVVIKENKVLLARHTYGGGKGMLIIPGGYVNNGETPQDALIREYLEETKITVKPLNIIGIRFNMHDWYIAFRAEYVSGEAVSDGDEMSLDMSEGVATVNGVQYTCTKLPPYMQGILDQGGLIASLNKEGV